MISPGFFSFGRCPISSLEDSSHAAHYHTVTGPSGFGGEPARMEKYRTRDELRAAIRSNKKEIERLDQASSGAQRLGLPGSKNTRKEHEAAVEESNALAKLWTQRGYK